MSKEKKGEKEFVAKFFKAIDDNRDRIAMKIKEERPKMVEMSTMKPEDALRKINI